MLTRRLVRPIVSPLVRSVTQRGRRGLVLGPELIVNGSPLAAAGWTLVGEDATHIVTFAGGTMRYQSGTTSPQLQVLQNVLTVGKLYQFVAVVSVYASGGVKTDSLGAGANGAISGVGTFMRRGVAIQAGMSLTRASANVDITFEKISVREILSGA